MSITAEAVQQFLSANPTFAEDDHNAQILLSSMKQNPEWFERPDALSEFVNAAHNKPVFHWLAVAEQKKVDRRRVAEILRDAGVAVSTHYSATQRKLDEQAAMKEQEKDRDWWIKFNRRKERDRAIEAANNIWIDLPYAPPGPGSSRKDFRRSEEAKQKELARIAIEFKDVTD